MYLILTMDDQARVAELNSQIGSFLADYTGGYTPEFIVGRDGNSDIFGIRLQKIHVGDHEFWANPLNKEYGISV